METNASRAPSRYEPIPAVIRGPPQRARTRKLMVTFKLFVDESGNAPNQSHFVLGGYLSTVALWDRLTEEWDYLRRAWGISAFHMAHAEALEGEFAAWNPDTKDCRVATLARIVGRHVIRGFACDVRRKVYEGLVEKTADANPKRFAAVVRSPYAPMALFLMTAVGQECEKRGFDRRDVCIVFADRKGISARERRTVDRMCKWSGFRSPQFEQATDIPPLQAADMLAWSIYQNCKQREPGMRLRVAERHRALLKRLLVSRITSSELDSVKICVTARVLEPAEVAKAKKKALRIFPTGPISWHDPT